MRACKVWALVVLDEYQRPLVMVRCLRTIEDVIAVVPVQMKKTKMKIDVHIRQYPYDVSHYGRNRTKERYLAAYRQITEENRTA